MALRTVGRMGRDHPKVGSSDEHEGDALASVLCRPLPSSLLRPALAALEKAAIARRARAELKQQLRLGSITFRELLARASTDDVISKIKVLAVLESLPGLGKVKARRVLDEAGVSETRRVQGLGAHQKEKLLVLLDGPKP